MVELIESVPDNTIAITAVGKVTGKDYETVIIPLIEEKLGRHEKLRLLYHCGPEMDGFDAAAVWDDAKVGLAHLTAWEKIALVSDQHWILQSVKALGFLMPCEVRVFEGDKLEEAKAWISA